jgi:L-alanine-DL-glutamate epimerase-like enolase superfamily enzyme
MTKACVPEVTITGIEISQHRLAFDPPFHASWDTKPRHHWDATIVRVHSDAGLTGIGSGDLMLGFAGHEPLFVGQDALAIERHWRIINNINFHYGRCWPLDLALWDLAGKIANQPCWKLLGGLSDRVRAYASSGTLREPQALAEAAQAYLARGFPAMKIRFHRGDWRKDIKALEAVRHRVGERLELMVDCNQGWRSPQDTYPPWSLKDAVTVARELEKLGIYWMEEPLHRGDREGMRRLRGMTDIRIAGGEMTRELYEFRDLITEGALDVLQPDVALVGGITGLRTQPHIHAPHLDEWHGRDGQRAARGRHGGRPFPGISLRSAGMGSRPTRLHARICAGRRSKRVYPAAEQARHGVRSRRGHIGQDENRLTGHHRRVPPRSPAPGRTACPM